jgi:selenocysteine lyase/cysteine desulfurase
LNPSIADSDVALRDDSARADFDIPPDVIFLNTANIGPRLHAVRAAEQRSLDRWAKPWLLTADDWFADTERLRSLAAPLFNADADDIAIIPSLSYAMATAVRNVAVGRGQSIVMLREEFPSNYYAWSRRANETGAVVRMAARRADGSWTDPIVDAIDSSTAVVAVPVCHWTDGALIGIADVARRARAVGAALVIDASQSLGVVPLDVRALDPDFVVSVGYKWLLGPYGMSYLYVAPRHRTGLPIEEAWAMRRGSQDLSRLTEYQDTFREGARRFDAGEHQNFILLPMAIAALEHAAQWGSARVIEWMRVLGGALAEIGDSLGLSPTPSSVRAPHFLGFRSGRRAREIAASLAANRVYVAVRGDVIRFSPHIHTTLSDIATCADALSRAVRNVR